MPDDVSAPVRGTPYWRRSSWDKGASLPPGHELAQLRRGLGRAPGSVPGMWPLYTELTGSGSVTRRLLAEHISLGLFGLHQQSGQKLVHTRGSSVGAAAAALKRSGRYSEDAVDRRLVACASSATVENLSVHLRGLVQQLAVAKQPLDYDRLLDDLVRWQSPQGAGQVRRRWGGDYYARPDPKSAPPLNNPASGDT